MAAKTPDSIIRENVGSLNLLICDFSTTNIDNDDTYATGLPNIVGDPWFAATKDPTAGGEGMNISKSGTTLTFRTPEADITGTLYILTRN